MDPATYRQVCDLFHELADLDDAAREARLRDALAARTAEHGADDATDFETALRELLDAPDMDELAETRLGELGRQVLQDAVDDDVDRDLWIDPERIGSYRVLRRLGEGGMGIVYEAQRDDSTQRAALKVIRPEAGSADSSARFEREAGVLRQLRHPGIAAFFDAGEASVRMPSGAAVAVPYLAMEAVDGVPLGRHADVRALDARQRLELMARVCDAVHHAHERGVIHRDLKPGNVLVLPPDGRDPIGQPKVLDFGLARLTDADGPTMTQTRSGLLMGTLPYMSPEQVAGRQEDLDARSDVYSLGVMLFELLSGQLPYPVRGRPLAEGARIIQMDEATRLASLVPSLSGPIDHVLTQALEKDPARRYATAADLAADLRAAAEGRVVMARAPGLLRRIRRWSVRHPALGAAGLVGAASLVVLAFLLVQSLEATELARNEAATAERALDFMTSMYASEDPNFSRGETITVREALEREAQRIQAELADEPALRARLLAALGATFQSIRLTDQAGPLIAEALQLSRAVHGADHPETLEVEQRWASQCVFEGRLDEAAAIHRRVLAQRSEQLGPEHLATLQSQLSVAQIEAERGEYAQAEPRIRAALEAYERLLPADDPKLIACLGRLGHCVERQGRYDEADELFTAARDRSRRALGELHPETILAAGRLANFHAVRGRNELAAELMQEAFEGAQALWGAESESAVRHLSNLTDVLHAQGRYDEALEVAEQAAETLARVVGESHPSTLVAQVRLARSQRHVGDLRGAEQTAVPALLALREHNAGDPNVATLLSLLADISQQTGRPDKAAPLLEEALEIHRRNTGDRSRATIVMQLNLGNLYIQTDRLDEAGELFDALTPVAIEVLGPTATTTISARLSRAIIAAISGRHDEAEERFASTVRDAAAALGVGHPSTQACVGQFAGFLGSIGRHADAAAVREEYAPPAAED